MKNAKDKTKIFVVVAVSYNAQGVIFTPDTIIGVYSSVTLAETKIDEMRINANYVNYRIDHFYLND